MYNTPFYNVYIKLIAFVCVCAMRRCDCSPTRRSWLCMFHTSMIHMRSTLLANDPVINKKLNSLKKKLYITKAETGGLEKEK